MWGVRAVPDQPDDDGLVPPIKVMRKRLNGVYSAEGFAGPTRRYILIVAMLVGLASLPTLAAITAGSNELDDGRPGAMDGPFIPPASTGPVRMPPAPSASAGPRPAGNPPAGPSVPGSPGPLQGQAQQRKTRPRPVAPVKSDKGYAQSTRGGSKGSSASPDSGTGSSTSSSDRWESWLPGSWSGSGSWDSEPAGSGSGSSSSGSSGSGSSGGGAPGGAGSSPGKPVPVRPPVLPTVPAEPDDSVGPGGGGTPDDADPADDHSPGGDGHGDADTDDDQPDPPARPVRPPWCLDRSDCSWRPSHHHGSDRPRYQHCGDGHRRRSADGTDHDRATTVHIEPSGHGDKPRRDRPRRDQAGRDRTGRDQSHRDQSHRDREGRDQADLDESHHGRAAGHREKDRRDRSTTDSPAGRNQPEQIIRTIRIRTAEAARSDSRRRSAVTERPQNVRPARTADRTHNSHRYQPHAADRGEGTQTTTATRAYRGSHRAERMHRSDDRTGAHHRSSRMGRHHAELQQDNQDHQQNRW